MEVQWMETIKNQVRFYYYQPNCLWIRRVKRFALSALSLSLSYVCFSVVPIITLIKECLPFLWELVSILFFKACSRDATGIIRVLLYYYTETKEVIYESVNSKGVVYIHIRKVLWAFQVNIARALTPWRTK